MTASSTPLKILVDVAGGAAPAKLAELTKDLESACSSSSLPLRALLRSGETAKIGYVDQDRSLDGSKTVWEVISEVGTR